MFILDHLQLGRDLGRGRPARHRPRRWSPGVPYRRRAPPKRAFMLIWGVIATPPNRTRPGSAAARDTSGGPRPGARSAAARSRGQNRASKSGTFPTTACISAASSAGLGTRAGSAVSPIDWDWPPGHRANGQTHPVGQGKHREDGCDFSSEQMADSPHSWEDRHDEVEALVVASSSAGSAASGSWAVSSTGGLAGSAAQPFGKIDQAGPASRGWRALMNKSLLAVLNDAERLLVDQTGRAELAALDEDAAIALEARIRRARNKYVGQYRRAASAAVAEHGGRGRARPENTRAALKAEAFEEALSRVSRRVAALARQSAAELRAERLAAARAAKQGQAPGAREAAPTAGPRAAAVTGEPTGDRALRSPVMAKRRASTRAAGARRQAKRDSR